MLSGERREHCYSSDSSSCTISPATLAYAYAACYGVLYAFGNQLGDAALQLSYPRWLCFFESTTFRTPGLGLGLRLDSLGSLVVRRPASAISLSTYMTFLRSTCPA